MNATEVAAAGAGFLRRLRGNVGDVVFIIGALIVGYFLWPTSLGGCTTLTVVSGHSMEPTYYTGDLVISRCGEYQVGDVVTYNPPNVGNARVIHRIIGGDESGWVIQGDNNDFLDPWQPTDENILGKSVVRLPKVALVSSFLVNPLTWVSLFLVAGALVIWPSKPDEESEEQAEAPADGLRPEDPAADDPFRVLAPRPAPAIEQGAGDRPAERTGAQETR